MNDKTSSLSLAALIDQHKEPEQSHIIEDRDVADLNGKFADPLLLTFQHLFHQ